MNIQLMPLLALLTMLLSGCQLHRVITDCPDPTPIDAETQRRAAEELEKLPPDTNIGLVLAAASLDRDKLRACRAIK